MRIIWQAYDTKNYTGGPIVNALRLLPELKRRGHEILAVIEYYQEHPNADQLRNVGVECYAFPTPRYSEDHVKIYLEQIVKFKPDIFVSNVSAHAGLAGHWAVRWGIPVIHTHRSDDPLNNGMAEFFFAGDQKWRLSALVAVNRYLADKIQALKSSPILYKIIPSGVPLSPFKVDQSNVTKLKVVYSGRIIEKQKRISDVVRAFIYLASTSNDIEFSIIGSGETKLVESLKQLIRKEGLEGRFQFTGKLHGDEYKKALSNHHIIVLLSDYEGIPGSLMDGMSCGLVPVVYGINGIEELVIDNVNGIVLHDRSESFVKAILELKRNERLRIKLSSEAVQTIVKKFSLEFAADEWENLFLHLKRTINNKKDSTIKMPTKIDLFRFQPLLLQYAGKPGIQEKLSSKLKTLGISGKKKTLKIEKHMATVLRRFASRIIPKKIKSSIKKYRKSTSLKVNKGDNVYCIICQSPSPIFAPFGYPERKNARCLKCGSLERHRLLWNYLQNKTNLFTKENITLLHFAPEKFFFNRFIAMSGLEYCPCDISPELFKFDTDKKITKVDITSIPFPDNYFDVVLCNHVLEHIPDDKKAMSELYRVMKKGAWGIFQVPIDYAREKTYEDFSIALPEARKAAFGQSDHVRWYGQDYKDRLSSARFQVTEDDYVLHFSPEEMVRFGFTKNELIYHCKKE